MRTRPAPGEEPGTVRVTGCPTWPQLCAELGRFLAEHADDPFSVPVLVVPGPAHRRDISQRLAADPAGPRVFAGVATPTPGQLRADLERRLLGLDPDADPWRSGALAVRVAALLRESSAEPWFALVQRHLDGHPAPEERPRPTPGRLIATAEDYVRLVRGYLRSCPGMLRAWSRGSLVDPLGAALTDRDIWQAQLWRRLVPALGDWPDPGLRHEQLCRAALDAEAGALPPALGLVCLEAPPAPDVELLGALASRLPVEVWQLGSPDWADTGGPPLRERYGTARARSWQYWAQAPVTVRSCRAGAGGPQEPSMLARLQQCVRGERTPGAPVEADGSVSIHVSHGPDRQVEVLREALCDAFDSDPTLQPRDVVVLCTDIATYAPLLEADLGPTAVAHHHPGHDLRARVAGPSLERPNRVLTVLLSLLALPSARATSSELLALASLEPVARAFGFDAESLERLGRLVERSQVRWGVDAAHRAQLGLAEVRQDTWLTGIDRLLAGLVMADAPLTSLGTVVPLDHVDGSDAELVGALAELVSRVRMHLLRFREPAGIAQWRDRLLAAATDLTRPEGEDQWMLNHLSSALAELSCGEGPGSMLDAGDIAAVLRRLVRPQRGRADFGAGSMTICGLGEVQGIDHRVVALLGVDDAHFPPRVPARGEDLLTRLGAGAQNAPDAACEARQQLLDAVLSAGERLIIVGAGADPRTGEALPQPVVMADLVAALTGREPATVWAGAHRPRPDGGPGGGPSVLHVHPLQPYAPSAFDPDAAGGPLGFDAMALAGAQAAAQGRAPGRSRGPVWTVRGPEVDDGAVSVDELASFYRDPIRAWVGHSFGFLPGEDGDELPTGLPIVLNGLETWAVEESITQALISGQDARTVSDAALLGGRLPPGQLGTGMLASRLPALEAYASTVRELLVDPTEHDLAWQEGPSSVSGTVLTHAGRIVRHRYARLRARHIAAAWVELVCAVAAGAPVSEALLVGRDECLQVLAPPAAPARALLGQLCRLRLTGLSQFLPMPPDTSLGYARRTSRGQRSAGSFLAHDYARELSFSPVLQWVGARWQDIEAIASEPEDPLTSSPGRFVNLARWFYEPIARSLHPWAPGGGRRV